MTGPFGTTAGPWSICIDDSGDRPWGVPSVQAPESEDYAIVHWDGFWQEYWQSANGDKRQIAANARSIAQVPAMLALVQAVRSHYTPHSELVEMASAIISELESE